MKNKNNLAWEFFRPTTWKIVLALLLFAIFYVIFFLTFSICVPFTGNNNSDFAQGSTCSKLTDIMSILFPNSKVSLTMYFILLYLISCLIIKLMSRIKGGSKK